VHPGCQRVGSRRGAAACCVEVVAALFTPQPPHPPPCPLSPLLAPATCRQGGSLGELNHAIVVDQFSRLRQGDSWWYERVGVLDSATLAEVQRTLVVSRPHCSAALMRMCSRGHVGVGHVLDRGMGEGEGGGKQAREGLFCMPWGLVAVRLKGSIYQKKADCRVR
jgi:hypothetical protein